MDVLAQGAFFYSPNEELTYSPKEIVFADDNTNYNNQFKVWLNQTPSDATVLEGIQKDSQTWE